jgi:hypothetical protein
MYRIIFWIDGNMIEGKPVDADTVRRTVDAFLDNGIAVFKVKKIGD